MNLVSETVDSWVWKNDKIGGYLVKLAYSILKGLLRGKVRLFFNSCVRLRPCPQLN